MADIDFEAELRKLFQKVRTLRRLQREYFAKLKRAGLVEATNGEFNEYRQTRLGAEMVEMYTNPYYYGNEGAPLSQQDLSEWETWRKKSSNATGSTSSTATS